MKASNVRGGAGEAPFRTGRQMPRDAASTAKHFTHADRYGAKQAALPGSPMPRGAQARPRPRGSRHHGEGREGLGSHGGKAGQSTVSGRGGPEKSTYNREHTDITSSTTLRRGDREKERQTEALTKEINLQTTG